MKPGAIECAFQGVCGRDPQRRTSERTGRDWATFSVACGEGEKTQWIDVACFGPSVDAAMDLAKGDYVYVQGRIELRVWQNTDGTSRATLSVAASVIQPMGKIGNDKPRKTRVTSRAKPAGANAGSAAYHQPLPFDDELPI